MRVLVVRQDARARETAARLVARGHAAVLAPILSIVPTGRPPPPGPFDGVLVTSRNAPSALVRHRERFATAEIFAVGARTGAALEQAGFHHVRVAGGDAATLAVLVRERMPSGSRLLHTAGRDRRAEPAASLLARGYEVETWETYAAEPALRLPDAAREALAAGEVDAVLHYSPRSAAILARLVGEAGLGEAWRRPLHACLSANVAAALVGAGDALSSPSPRLRRGGPSRSEGADRGGGRPQDRTDEDASRPPTRLALRASPPSPPQAGGGLEALRVAVAAEPSEHALLALLDGTQRTD